MFKLQKLNIVKIVDSEKKKNKLISDGYKLLKIINKPVENAENEKVEETKTENSFDYSGFDFQELRKLANERGVEGYIKMNKEQLVLALQAQ